MAKLHIIPKILCNFAHNIARPIPDMDLSIVIVNYRVKFFLEQTLASAIEATQGISAEIIVVDNNSGDDSIAHCRKRFGSVVTFVENTENVGFARANNQAIMQAQGTYTLILNPDTIITHDAIAQCVEWMEAHDRCGAIGVKMLDGNGVFLPESKRAFPTPWVAFCKIFGLSKLFPKSPVFAKYHLRYLSENEAHKVDILAGAYMFCRTSLLKNLSGFDEDFFMYGEDIDLSYRIVKAGFENWYLPVPIIHYKGESTRKESMRYVEIFYGAMLIFYRKHFPRFRTFAYPIVKAGVVVRKSMAKLSRLRQKFFGANNKAQAVRNWTVLSSDPKRVAAALGIESFNTQLPPDKNADVLLCNDSYSYGEIVNMIRQYSRPDVRFHIFSNENSIVISPKMLS